MRRSQELPTVSIKYVHPVDSDRLMAKPLFRTVTAVEPRVVRCACEHCGAHTNAVWTSRVGGSCPTCGSFRLAPLRGAALMDGSALVV
jgi:hypothetical protein